jgi:hypothetical protein
MPPPSGDALTAGYETWPRDGTATPAAPDWAFRSALHLLTQPVDAAISLLLEEVGLGAAADRAWMFEYDAEVLRFRNTHEWCRPGVPSFLSDLQDAPVTMIAWLQQYLQAGRAVMIARVKALPRAARALQVEMLRQGDQSVLSVPVFHDGRLRACIGFDAVRGEHRWPPSEIGALFQCANLIASARYGAAGKMSTAERADFAPLIYLRRRGGMRGVTKEMIIGLRSARNYTEIWLTDGSLVLDLRPLAIWSALVPAATFLRIHRTAIVNTMHIRDVERPADGKWLASMRGIAKPWTVSRPYRQELRKRLGI